MTYNEFFQKYNQKYVDFDGYYGYQCVDLYRQYVKEVLEAPQSPGVSGARNIWTTYRTDVFTYIPNSPTNFPQKGDVVIWDKPAGGGYGHVGIADSANSMSFISFDQNWGPNLKCHLQPHNYTNVLGWLRPKKKVDDIITPEVIENSQAPTTSNTQDTPSDETADISPEVVPNDVSDITSGIGTSDSVESSDVVSGGDTDTTAGDPDTTIVTIPPTDEEMGVQVPQDAPIQRLPLIDFLKKIWRWISEKIFKS